MPEPDGVVAGKLAICRRGRRNAAAVRVDMEPVKQRRIHRRG